MRNPLSILIILVWLILAFFYWDSSNKCCDSNTDTTSIAAQQADGSSTVASTNIAKTGPLLFNWDKPNATTIDGWAEKKSSILTELGSDKTLEIIGRYRSDETNNTTYADLGLARANEVRKLFTELPDERVRQLSKLIDMQDGDKTNLFESCDFDYKINTTSIKEVEDKTRIYFPFNSTNKLQNTEVEKYLDDVASRVAKSGEGVNLVGHTDNIGNDAPNIALGQRRADIIKRYLVSKGVSSTKINATSQGEANPIADNNTEKGRADNRRTELQIIK